MNKNEVIATKIADNFVKYLKEILKKHKAIFTFKYLDSKCDKDPERKVFVEISPNISNLLQVAKDQEIPIDLVLVHIQKKIITSFEKNEGQAFWINLNRFIYGYEDIKTHIAIFFILDDESDKKYIDNMYKQFIESNVLYKSVQNFENDNNDCGPFIFNDEINYINRCLYSWIDLVEKLV